MTHVVLLAVAGSAALGGAPTMSPELVSRGNIVRVHVVGTPAQNGAALLDAMAGITTNSPSNPFLMQIGPGTFDIGAATLNLKPWVSVEGSGLTVTYIMGEARANPAAVVAGSAWAGTFGRLSVKCGGSGAYCIAADISGAPTYAVFVRDAGFSAFGGATLTMGARFAGPIKYLGGLHVGASGPIARGLVLEGWTTLDGADVTVLNATDGLGVSVQASNGSILRRITTYVLGNLASGSGLRLDGVTNLQLDEIVVNNEPPLPPGTTFAAVRAVQSQVAARRLTTTSGVPVGYDKDGGSLILEDSRVAGEVGILNRSGGLAIRASTILGTTAAISSPSAAFITIALSQVGGPIVAAGGVSCTLSYDANNVSAGLNVCP